MLIRTLFDLAGSFGLGLITPMTAVCVLPLYPGFVAYLSNRSSPRLSVPVLGLLVAAGVVSFMSGVGLLFTTVLQVSLTVVIEPISTAAFGILAIASLALLADIEVGGRLPSIDAPTSKRPAVSAYGYGLFFGAIVLPCNPGLIALFFARSLLFSDPLVNLLNFLAYGIGIATPLLGLALLSGRYSDRVIAWLTTHRSVINRGTGAVMLVISGYYLLVVFDVFGIGSALGL